MVYISLTLLCWQIWAVDLLLNLLWLSPFPTLPSLQGSSGYEIWGNNSPITWRKGVFLPHCWQKHMFCPVSSSGWKKYCRQSSWGDRDCFQLNSFHRNFIHRNKNWIFISTLFQRAQANSKATEGMFYSKDKRLQPETKGTSFLPAAAVIAIVGGKKIHIFQKEAVDV